jgi:hypothetical protein
MIKAILSITITILPLLGFTQPVNPEAERLKRPLDAEKARMQRDVEFRRESRGRDDDSVVLQLLQSPEYGGWSLVSRGRPESVLFTRSLGAQESSQFELLSFRLRRDQRWGTISCVVAPCAGLSYPTYIVSDLKLVQVSCDEVRSRSYLSTDGNVSATSPQEVVTRMYSTINTWRGGSLDWSPASAEDLVVCPSR